jgi:hypothetical protein
VLVVGMDWPFTKPDSSWTAGTRLMWDACWLEVESKCYRLFESNIGCENNARFLR